MRNLKSLPARRRQTPPPGRRPYPGWWWIWLLGAWLLAGPVACTPAAADGRTDISSPPERLSLPALPAAPLEERPLRVVATTSIIGDVVGRVGDQDIALTTLMAAGQDPHTFQPTPRALTAVAEADVIFVNGWDLEEGLLRNLESVRTAAVLVPVSAGVQPRPVLLAEYHDEGDAAVHQNESTAVGTETAPVDPHVWLDPANVVQWTANIVTTLSALDPANAALYQARGADYQAAVNTFAAAAGARLASIPRPRRQLVTGHGALTYFAAAFDFDIIGAVIPARSTLAEPSASDLAALAREMNENAVCTIFTDSADNSRLAETVAAEVAACAQIQLVPLYTGALGPPGSGADTYLGMMDANVTAIVQALQ